MKTLVSVVTMIITIVATLAAQDATPLSGSQKRFLTEKDLFDFVWVANPQLSPDGSRVAFTRVTVDEKRTNYETSIWIAATKSNEIPIRMTNGRHDAQPRWSPSRSMRIRWLNELMGSLPRKSSVPRKFSLP